MNRILTLCVVSLTTLLFVSCQGTDRRAVSMNYSDAVTSIHQVDPAYRAYFRSQQGADYSAAEQRAALVKTVQTMRTPVPTVAPVRLTQRRVGSRSRSSIATSKARKSSRNANARLAKNTKKGKAVNTKKRSSKALAANSRKRRRG